MSDPIVDRWLQNIRNIILDTVNPRLRYSGIFDYVVLNSSPGTVDAQPNDGSLGLPLVRSVPLFSGLPSAQVQLNSGTHVAIGFLDQNPAKPVGFAFSANTGDQGLSITWNCASISAGDQTAAPVTPSAWSTALEAALTALATSLGSAVTLGNVAAAGTALGTALGLLPPDATTKFKGT